MGLHKVLLGVVTMFRRHDQWCLKYQPSLGGTIACCNHRDRPILLCASAAHLLLPSLDLGFGEEKAAETQYADSEMLTGDRSVGHAEYS